jgi:hypothetical protein
LDNVFVRQDKNRARFTYFQAVKRGIGRALYSAPVQPAMFEDQNKFQKEIEMTRKTYEYIEMLYRVLNFWVTRPNLFPKESGGLWFAALSESLGKLSEHTKFLEVSRSTVRANVGVRDVARENLRKHLQRISTTAEAIAIGSPGIESKFRIPNRKREATLIETAGVFAHLAQPLKQDFIQHQMPPDFIDRLKDAAEELNVAVINDAAGKKSRANSEAAAAEELGNCLKLLKRVDAVVENAIGDDVPLMAEWRNTRRVVTRIRSKRETTGAAPNSDHPSEPTSDPPAA